MSVHVRVNGWCATCGGTGKPDVVHVNGKPMCTCGSYGTRSREHGGRLHSITCLEAATQPHAMINHDGDVFYPDNAEDARYFAEQLGAWPLKMEGFPFAEDVSA